MSYTQTATFENAKAVVRILCPNLTEPERTRRMEAIQAATVALIKSKWSE